MLTDPKLRSQVDSLWDKFWTRVSGMCEPPDMFSADAVERWFTKIEVEEVMKFVSKLEMSRNDN